MNSNFLIKNYGWHLWILLNNINYFPRFYISSDTVYFAGSFLSPSMHDHNLEGFIFLITSEQSVIIPIG
jgi:hypothetical protein